VPEEIVELPKKPKCPECGGTGLKSDPILKTALCECPAGRSRGRMYDDD
jgi:hypothetical protein